MVFIEVGTWNIRDFPSAATIGVGIGLFGNSAKRTSAVWLSRLNPVPKIVTFGPERPIEDQVLK
jgi:hypothetical protein